jgi:hypothetical protein
MADTVSSYNISYSGGPSRKLVMSFTNLSDGTGESAIAKVTPSSFVGPNGLAPSKIAIERIDYSINGGSVKIYYALTSPITVAQLTGYGHMCFFPQTQGFIPNSGGSTGAITFTTDNFAAHSSYTIVLHMRLLD